MEFKERYVKTFYENLEKGKLMGQKCNKCGTYQIYPVPVCSNCQGTDLEWTEFSKEGKLIVFSISYYPPVFFASLAPFSLGVIQLKEGPLLYCITEGIDINNPEKEFKRLPLNVDLSTKEIAGNFIPVAKVRE